MCVKMEMHILSSCYSVYLYVLFWCVQSVFTYVTSGRTCLLKQKKVFILKKSSTPTRMVCYINMADFSLLRTRTRKELRHDILSHL